MGRLIDELMISLIGGGSMTTTAICVTPSIRDVLLEEFMHEFEKEYKMIGRVPVISDVEELFNAVLMIDSLNEGEEYKILATA
jgi:hypothetical protein